MLRKNPGVKLFGVPPSGRVTAARQKLKMRAARQFLAAFEATTVSTSNPPPQTKIRGRQTQCASSAEAPPLLPARNTSREERRPLHGVYPEPKSDLRSFPGLRLDKAPVLASLCSCARSWRAPVGWPKCGSPIRRWQPTAEPKIQKTVCVTLPAGHRKTTERLPDTKGRPPNSGIKNLGYWLSGRGVSPRGPMETICTNVKPSEAVKRRGLKLFRIV
jgi:hypothetical protein